MADTKLSALASLTDAEDGDFLAIIDDPSGTPVTKKITRKNLMSSIPMSGGTGSELTIASGEVTRVESYHVIDTEADAASDNLDGINLAESGSQQGKILTIGTADNARDVTVVDNATPAPVIDLAGTFGLTNVLDTLTIYNFNATLMIELCRSNNS